LEKCGLKDVIQIPVACMRNKKCTVSEESGQIQGMK